MGEIAVKELDDVLKLTDNLINKKYLSNLSVSGNCEVCELKLKDKSVDVLKHGRIFHLKKLIYDNNENFLHKLITVVNVAYALKGTIVTAIQSNNDVIDFYIGIVAKEGKGKAGSEDREALLNAFEGTIQGNFGGSSICSENEEMNSFCNAIAGNAICSVSVVPSLRNNNDGILSYVQGIENLVD